MGTKSLGLPLGLLLAVAQLALCAGPSHTNVVLIVADYMGYSDTEPYGATDIRTPSLNRLAAEGVRLTDAYATAPICSPSRAALLTGRYQQRFGLEGSIRRGGLPQSELTIAKILQNQGYATAMVGKWHLGLGESGPNAHGFDEALYFNESMIDYYSHRTQSGTPALLINDKPVEVEGYSTDIFTDRAVSFIEDHLDQAFFVFLAYNATLPPLQPPGQPDDIRASESGASAGSWYRSTRSDYIKVVESLDAGIGRVLESLSGAGLLETTMVIFTCDHGGTGVSRNSPLSNGFGSFWEGGIRVPCIIRWPEQFAGGTVTSQQASLLDLMPTILAATGSDIPMQGKLDGINLVQLLTENAVETERTFFWRTPPYSRRPQKAVRQASWKLLEESETLKLFNLERDISEQVDVSHEHPEVVRELHTRLRKWETELAP